jgi:hypothetical protein
VLYTYILLLSVHLVQLLCDTVICSHIKYTNCYQCQCAKVSFAVAAAKKPAYKTQIYPNNKNCSLYTTSLLHCLAIIRLVTSSLLHPSCAVSVHFQMWPIILRRSSCQQINMGVCVQYLVSIAYIDILATAYTNSYCKALHIRCTAIAVA